MIEIINLLCISLSLFEYKFTNYCYFNYDYFKFFLYLHILSQFLFTYIVFLSSFFEFFSFIFNYYQEYMNIVPYIDKYIVGTLLNISCFSGIIISKIKYKKNIPMHINNVINYLIYFGIFWALTDKTTQTLKSEFIFYIRLFINVISCIFIIKIKNFMLRN